MATNVQYILSLKDQFTAGINTADASVKKLEGSMMGLKGIIASTFSVYAVSSFVRSMVEAGSKVEDAQTGLTTLLGNAKDASRVIQNTMEDATKTPFAFEGLLNANKALISAGVNADNARQDVLNLGNAIAATGGGDAEMQRMVVNLQQISNTGKATALDIKQFAFAGVNIYKVLEAAGIKANAKGEESAITYEQITMALKRAHEAGGIYYHGLENMAGNTSVKISNLGDAVFQLKVKMFNDLKPAIEGVLTGLFKLIDHLKDGWNWFVKYKDEVKAAAVGMGTFIVTMKTVIPVMQGFGVTTMAALGPVTLMITAISTLAMAYMDYVNSTELAIKAQNDFAKNKGIQEVGLLEADMSYYVKAGKKESEARAIVAKNRREEYIKELKDTEETLIRFDDRINTLRSTGFGGQADDMAKERQKYAGDLETIKAKLGAVTEFENQGLVNSSKASTSANTSVQKVGKTRAETRAVGSKSVTINVHNDSIIKAFTIQTTNIKEGADKLKEMVVNALASALNDFQVVAE